MSDFFYEIQGLSTKEMTASENVSIPDINKVRLCNVETLTNKRHLSDKLQHFGGRSADIKTKPKDDSVNHFLKGYTRIDATA